MGPFFWMPCIGWRSSGSECQNRQKWQHISADRFAENVRVTISGIFSFEWWFWHYETNLFWMTILIDVIVSHEVITRLYRCHISLLVGYTDGCCSLHFGSIPAFLEACVWSPLKFGLFLASEGFYYKKTFPAPRVYRDRWAILCTSLTITNATQIKSQYIYITDVT